MNIKGQTAVRPYRNTLLLIALMLLLSQPAGGGTFLALLWASGWVMYAPLAGLFGKNRRLWRHKTALWLAAFAVVAAVHHIYEYRARQAAQTQADRLHGFYTANRHYPDHRQWPLPKSYHLRYICFADCQSGKMPPLLFYASAGNPFNRYDYDFERRQWRLELD